MTRVATISDDPIADSISAIRALREEAEQQRAAVDDRIERLNRAEAALELLVAGRDEAPAAPADPPKGERGQGSRRRRTSTPRAAKPAEEKAEGGGSGAEQGRQNREAILRVIRERPGVSSADIVEATRLERSTVATHLGKLVRAPQGSGRPPIRMEKDPRDGRIRRYLPSQADVAPADTDGAKTVDERKILNCLRGAQGPLPPGEISVRTGIRSDHVPQMAQQMAKRGVIERVPPKREGMPPRYQPSRNGERPLEAAIEDAIA